MNVKKGVKNMFTSSSLTNQWALSIIFGLLMRYAVGENASQYCPWNMFASRKKKDSSKHKNQKFVAKKIFMLRNMERVIFDTGFHSAIIGHSL